MKIGIIGFILFLIFKTNYSFHILKGTIANLA